MSSDSSKHPLKSKWFVSYLPNLTDDLIKAHSNSYEEAQQATLKRFDYVTTIEAVFATMNSLLPWTRQPPKDALIFARDGVAPFFASFPGGQRLWVLTNSASDGRKAIEITLGLVMGESLRRVCNGEAAVQVVRIMHKPSGKSQDGLHLDLWLDSDAHCTAINAMIDDNLKRAGVSGSCKIVAM